MPASPTGEAGIIVQRSLQRNPDPEEVKSPLVETGVPVRRFLVAPVVDRAITPLTAGRGERSIPCRPRRRARAPRARPLAPRGAVEVAALVVAVPRPTRATGPSRSTGTAGTTRVIGTRAAGSTRSAWTAGVIGTGTAGPTRAAGPAGMTGSTRAAGRPAGTAGTTGTAWAPGIIRAGGGVEAPGLRCAMTTRTRRRTARCRVGKPGAHSQGRGAQCAGDGHPSDKLLQLHDASPIHEGLLRLGMCSEPPPDTTQTLDSFPMD